MSCSFNNNDLQQAIEPLTELCSDMVALLQAPVKLPLSSRNSERVKGIISRDCHLVNVEFRIELDGRSSLVKIKQAQIHQIVLIYRKLCDVLSALQRITGVQTPEEALSELENILDSLLSLQHGLSGNREQSENLSDYRQIELKSGGAVWVDINIVACELNLAICLRKNSKSASKHKLTQYERLCVASPDPYLISLGAKLESLHHRIDLICKNIRSEVLAAEEQNLRQRNSSEVES